MVESGKWGVEGESRSVYAHCIMMTVDQIVDEARQWPSDQLAELVDHLTLSLHQRIEPATEEAWKRETRRRVAEIEAGQVTGVPGDEVSRRVREIVGR
jgi:putative addiction module component (TIGR02574 family)